MYVLLSRDDDAQFEMCASKRSLESFLKKSNNDDHSFNKTKLIPKYQNINYNQFNKWCDNYSYFLEDEIKSLWSLLCDMGLNTRYVTFKQDMLRYIYNTSASRYVNFTFLGT